MRVTVATSPPLDGTFVGAAAVVGAGAFGATGASVGAGALVGAGTFVGAGIFIGAAVGGAAVGADVPEQPAIKIETANAIMAMDKRLRIIQTSLDESEGGAPKLLIRVGAYWIFLRKR